MFIMWLVLTMVSIILNFVLVILVLVSDSDQVDSEIKASYGVVYGLAILLMLYFWYVVNTLRKKISVGSPANYA